MNCPTRDPEPTGNPAFNQNPPMYEKTLVPRSSPVCGGGTLREDEYNTGLHVMALFVVLAQSTIACAFPLIAKRFPRLRIPPSFLFFARHFGTGVLIATAFVHLLPTAFISLTDPCLPAFWNSTFPAMAGAIALAAVFLVTTVEMVFTRGLCKGNYSPDSYKEATLEAGHHGRNEEKDGRVGVAEATDDDGSVETDAEQSRQGTPDSEHIGGVGGVGKTGFGMAGIRRSRSHSVGKGLQRFSEMSRSPVRSRQSDTISRVPEGNNEKDNVMSNDSSPVFEYALGPKAGAAAAHHAHNTSPLTAAQLHKKAMLQVFLLEMGILFHSVFIGMALSVTVGSSFIVLLIAIVFHQTFEGLALGSRIAVLEWSKTAWQPWVMALAYGLTTPVGCALGLGTHTLYSPQSQTGLLMVGIMNAISSGLLVFAGLVELLAEDFLSDESWHTLKGKRRIVACFWVFAGAFGMSFVGAFA